MMMNNFVIALLYHNNCSYRIIPGSTGLNLFNEFEGAGMEDDITLTADPLLPTSYSDRWNPKSLKLIDALIDELVSFNISVFGAVLCGLF